MRDTASPSAPPPGSISRSPQPASPAVINMDDSLNSTKESQRKSEMEESMLESSSAISENLQDTISTNNESDVEPMDISTKTTTTVDSDNQSDCSSSSPSLAKKYFCPICDITLTSQHEFTLHIRSHNNDNEIICEKGGFTCRICSKVLSSNSSLDRHMLVHSGERPFSCKICAVTFTTNGNMHRHMRTHSHKTGGENYESDASTDSNASINSNGKTRKRRLEFNNNKLDNHNNKRKSSDFINEDDDSSYTTSRRKSRNFNNNNINEITQKYHCPVCDREDFASLNVLETHLKDNHPDFEVKCALCNLQFKNHRELNHHRDVAHHTELLNNINNKNKNAHIGFNDLTFVDFSSEKFPQIARYACEKSLHKPVTRQKFVCEKCPRAFPCQSALDMHKLSCSNKNRSKTDGDHPTDLSRKNTSEEDLRRENFFAHLDLLNNSAPTSPSPIPTVVNEVIKTPTLEPKTEPLKTSNDSKDLADIQSILSMTSNGSLLQHLRTKPPAELIALPQENLRTPEQPNEEESQDVFAAEFRKMKLRGEFPCRLCTAVFPNLRALKGHNRAHLTGTGNSGPYRCNMCPHSSVDKAALIRHMRTHNGDRPYECSLCNYAFTTKANCERHLRNRHSKVTREEVKKSIIYHPSEDPTNDDINKLSSTGRNSDLKNSFSLSNSNDDDLRVTERVNNSTPKEGISPDLRNIMLPGLLPTSLLGKTLPISRSVLADHPINQLSKDLSNLKEPKVILKDEKPDFPFPKSLGFNYSPDILAEKLNEEVLHNKIKIKSLDGLKQIPDYDTHSEGDESSNNMSSSFDDYHHKPTTTEHPMDLSMDVLDLSKKKESPSSKIDDEPQDFSKKTLESTPTIPPQPTAAQILLAQQFLKNPYMNPHLSQLYQNPALFSNLSNLNIPPNPFSFFLPSHFPSQEMKERMLRFQLSGGSMITEQFPTLNPNGFQAFRQQQEMSAMQDFKYSSPSKLDEDIKPPLHINTQLGNDNINKLQSPKPQQKTPDMIHSPNSVKMVIKNGVLMPKQKQRRYRTERPFSCEHCSARFTLRSNMERHIKQQHPQYWSQRQRAGLSGAGRKPITPTSTSISNNTNKPFYDLNIPNFDMHIPKMPDSLVNETKDRDLNISPHHHIPLSQQVKYALLAQQLKPRNAEPANTFPKERVAHQDEDEDALIIDEENEDNEKPKYETKESTDSTRNIDNELKPKSLEEKMLELRQLREKEMKHCSEKLPNVNSGLGLLKIAKPEETGQDLVSVSRLLDNAVSSQLPFREYFGRDGEDNEVEVSEEDEEGLVASGSTSEGNGSGSDENKSENETATTNEPGKKKSAYSLAPNRVSCPYCHRKFPWTSSLRRHVLTHTGQKPFKCAQCPLLFTTKSNCDRHLLRKHGNPINNNNPHSDTPNNNNNNNNTNSQNYMMRNVPERPYKCSNCPSSTFSTLSNLKKHMSCKHTSSASNTDSSTKSEERPPSRDYESFASSEDERAAYKTDHHKQIDSKSDWETQISHTKLTTSADNSTVQNADLPFKCHLCEGSYAERQDALDHIRDMHVSEYELLMAKGALDANTSGHEENHGALQEPDDDEQLRGKFPDYANRKVMCAFCMRRFWSAEDLRRHMRTHTGERPFSCDVCNRRFTLKHSMLRHRKKHNFPTNALEDNMLVSGDEDVNIPTYDKLTKLNNNNHLVRGGGGGGGNSAGANKFTEKSSEEDSEGTEGNDLIGNLLGIRDKSIIDQVLVSSADDAAKLLGVNNGQE